MTLQPSALCHKEDKALKCCQIFFPPQIQSPHRGDWPCPESTRCLQCEAHRSADPQAAWAPVHMVATASPTQDLGVHTVSSLWPPAPPRVRILDLDPNRPGCWRALVSPLNVCRGCGLGGHRWSDQHDSIEEWVCSGCMCAMHAHTVLSTTPVQLTASSVASSSQQPAAKVGRLVGWYSCIKPFWHKGGTLNPWESGGISALQCTTSASWHRTAPPPPPTRQHRRWGGALRAPQKCQVTFRVRI
jgi:hypothetical protein